MILTVWRDKDGVWTTAAQGVGKFMREIQLPVIKLETLHPSETHSDLIHPALVA